MTHYREWTRRYLNGQLGIGSELWADVSAHPAAARLEALERAHGRSPDASSIAFSITRSLLLDVIHAAGGIEYTVEKLLIALDVVQQWADDHVSQPRQSLEYGSWVSAERWDVSFEVSNLVVWARTLVERLEAKAPGSDVRIGLLPALTDGDLKDQVKGFRDELIRWVEAEGWLAGYALHIGRLHGGTPSLRLESDGRVRFLLPDRPGSRVWSWEEFTYQQDRDARTVAVALLTRVERFMEDLLTIFEHHVPQRFRT
jgi:hypothetical protein